MGLLLNRAKANTATTGTGAVTPGSAVIPYQSWSAAGAVASSAYDYLIEDGNAWELGTGVYNGTTITRPGPGVDANFASSSGALLNLTGSATIACVANKNSGGGTLTTPTVRSSAIYLWNASTYNMPFPTGTAVGDLVIVYMENGYGPGAGPTGGWTQLGYANNGWTNGYSYAKVMTAGDITTGYVTVNSGGSYAGIIGIVAIQTGTYSSLDGTLSYGSSGSGSVSSLNITGLLSINAKDLFLGFIATRGQMSITVSSNLTILQTANQANASGIIVTQTSSALMTALGINETATFPAGNNGAIYFFAAFH